MTSVPDTLAASSDDSVDVPSGIFDVDSHEMIPTKFWVDQFGEDARSLLSMTAGRFTNDGSSTLMRDDIEADAMPVTSESVWKVKGPDAPSAIDLSRRPAVLDEMGVARQLVFPTFGIVGMVFIHNREAPTIFGFDPAEVDRVNLGRRLLDGHNAWAARMARELDPDRVRVVGIVESSGSVEDMMRSAEQAIESGVRALWLAGSVPPANTSPGDPALDPFWRLAAEAGVAVTLHIGTEFALLASTRWPNGVPAFVPAGASDLEFPVEPYRSSTLHLTATNFLAALVLGGVFERHPTLRFGVIECAAHWVGGLAENLDMWFDEFRPRFTSWSMRPSEHINRNIRVTPFYFEPVDDYFERYPKLQNVYSYGSDFPHREGGAYSAHKLGTKLARLGSEVAERFFVSNGQWLLPD
jgi:predicted TIM-barrel fold metal-dependent hydrolase